MKQIIFPILMLFLSLEAFAFTRSQVDQAKEEIVRLSIMHYPGDCPCPYSSTKKGLVCGRRSSYSPQAHGLKCFVQDVSKAEAIRYLNGKQY